MLAIRDLPYNKKLTRKAMAAVFGGHHGLGNYRHMHTSGWKRYYAKAFYVRVRACGRLRRAIQYQYSWYRVQRYHRGILRLV